MINNSKVSMKEVQRNLKTYRPPKPLLRSKTTAPSQTQFMNS